MTTGRVSPHEEEKRAVETLLSQAGARLAELRLNLACQEAKRLMLAGRLAEAEQWLSPQGHPPATAQAKDLLARLCYKTGRLDRAEELWTLAVRQEPGHAVYAKALRRLREVRLDPAKRVLPARAGKAPGWWPKIWPWPPWEDQNFVLQATLWSLGILGALVIARLVF